MNSPNLQGFHSLLKYIVSYCLGTVAATVTLGCHSGLPHGLVHDVFFPKTPAPYTPGMMNDVCGRLTDGIWEQIAMTLREFGFTPKGRARAYQKPYPDYFDTLPYP
jgi:hypothetical protein